MWFVIDVAIVPVSMHGDYKFLRQFPFLDDVRICRICTKFLWRSWWGLNICFLNIFILWVMVPGWLCSHSIRVLSFVHCWCTTFFSVLLRFKLWFWMIVVQCSKGLILHVCPIFDWGSKLPLMNLGLHLYNHRWGRHQQIGAMISRWHGNSSWDCSHCTGFCSTTLIGCQHRSMTLWNLPSCWRWICL